MTQTNNEREVIELNNIALKQQSEAWLAVFHVLNEVKPNWLDSNLPAMGCAVNAIKELAKSPISQNEQQEAVDLHERIRNLETQLQNWKDFCKKIQASPPKQIPDGWKLVPIVPTNEMQIAAIENYNECPECISWNGVYRAMLSASPTDKEVVE